MKTKKEKPMTLKQALDSCMEMALAKLERARAKNATWEIELHLEAIEIIKKQY